MPIRENGTIEYNIPKEIKEKIPFMFYQALFGELVSVFGFEFLVPHEKLYNRKDIVKDYTEMVSEFIFASENTSGYNAAFKQTCRKLSMEWLIDYEKTLDWYDSDIFFNEISTEMIRIFCEEKNKTENSYYTFLINNQEK